MADLAELYQQIIIEHNRSPRNFRTLPDATASAEGDNPLCGDRITVYVKLDGEQIADVAFQGKGCAISQASASLMTGAVKGRTVAEAEQLFHQFHDMVTGPAAPDPRLLGKLAAFAGVRQFPSRVKCANLAWHTLHAALTQSAESVSTE
jgi:nitrogen fixation NifU-like protein